MIGVLLSLRFDLSYAEITALPRFFAGLGSVLPFLFCDFDFYLLAAEAFTFVYTAFFFSFSDESPRLESLTESFSVMLVISVGSLTFLMPTSFYLVDGEDEPDELDELLLLSSTILF